MAQTIDDGSETDRPQSGDSLPGDNLRRARDLHRMMVRIRVFEETALDAHAAGEIPGPLHVSIGQEGIAAGLCANLRQDDRLTSNHRGHGHAIAKGAQATRMYLELYGREGGYCGGKGGSMHIADFSVGMLGANGVVAGGIPIAVGAAQGLKLLGRDAIAVAIFGDGAINRGPFLEGLNWAALYRLPVLFVCEDNGVAAFTEAGTVTAGAGVCARAEAIGVPARSVDGNDVLALDQAAGDLVAAVRRGDGPHLLHATTFRWTGHTSTDPASWRDPADVAQGKATCPILRLETTLTESGLSSDDIAAVYAEAQSEMSEARAGANAAPWPDPAIAFEDVQDAGRPTAEGATWRG
ncbi:MAG: thiamine pyrophosphate-dependent dehydrogenase E1 component subunit alpha [Pseudomonadota bacterium]